MVIFIIFGGQHWTIGIVPRNFVDTERSSLRMKKRNSKMMLTPRKEDLTLLFSITMFPKLYYVPNSLWEKRDSAAVLRASE